MKNINKRVALLLSVVILLFSLSATFFAETVYEHDGVLYTKVDNDHVSVYSYNGDKAELVIPDSVDEGFVSQIRAYGVQKNTTITSLDLSKAMHLTTLGMMCFNGCSSLSGALYVPYMITDVRMGAFQGCSSLDSVDFSARTELIPEVCFNRCTALSKVKISESVTTIGKLAFANCPNLSEVYIPSSVTDIHYTAFNNDEALVIYCYTGSYAQRFAIQYGYDYVLLDAPTPTEPPTQAPTVEPTQPATEAPTAEPTQPATEKPTESTGFILGDVDNNGVVSISDVTLIQRSLVNLDIPASCVISQGDVDNNGITGSSDAVFIMRYLINLTTGYPIGEIVTRE